MLYKGHEQFQSMLKWYMNLEVMFLDQRIKFLTSFIFKFGQINVSLF